MSFKVTIKKEGTLDGTAAEIFAEMRPRGEAAVRTATDMVLTRIDQKLSVRSDRPARPGEPPREVSGELRQSVKRIPQRTRVGLSAISVSSGIQSRHAGVNRLEFGATDSRGIRTFPHPFVRPTFEQLKRKLDALFAAI
jgi:hypothetical protein